MPAMEILSPAGSPQALRAAVASGADAVYFGGGGFNARHFAQNFEGEDMARAIAFCRQNGKGIWRKRRRTCRIYRKCYDKAGQTYRK